MDIFELSNNPALIFDFDGTICRLFAHYNLDRVVDELRENVKKYGIDFPVGRDSFDIFSEIINQTEDASPIRISALSESNQILTDAEIDAVSTGELVNGVEKVLPFLVVF